MEKEIYFTNHALDQMRDRGATEGEVVDVIRVGERVPSRHERWAYRRNFSFNGVWKNKRYRHKQVMPIVVEEESRFVVITVYVFYFGGDK